jgi:hypothetical protein
LNKKLAGAILAGTLLAFTQVGFSCDNTRTVDDKRELSVPGTDVRCYLLEVEEVDSGGSEVGESIECVDKALWDKNRTGHEYVGVDGQPL